MHGFPVEIVDKGIDWPAWVQAVGSVLAILVSVGLGIWLQDRGRSKKEAVELRNQVTALSAIGERCVKTIGRLQERALQGSFRPDILGWLTDEAEATEAAAAAVDLMKLRSPKLTKAVAELQEATRTARRRLGYSATAIKSSKQPKTDDFDDPLGKAKSALATIQQL